MALHSVQGLPDPAHRADVGGVVGTAEGRGIGELFAAAGAGGHGGILALGYCPDPREPTVAVTWRAGARPAFKGGGRPRAALRALSLHPADSPSPGQPCEPLTTEAPSPSRVASRVAGRLAGLLACRGPRPQPCRQVREAAPGCEQVVPTAHGLGAARPGGRGHRRPHPLSHRERPWTALSAPLTAWIGLTPLPGTPTAPSTSTAPQNAPLRGGLQHGAIPHTGTGLKLSWMPRKPCKQRAFWHSGTLMTHRQAVEVASVPAEGIQSLLSARQLRGPRSGAAPTGWTPAPLAPGLLPGGEHGVRGAEPSP